MARFHNNTLDFIMQSRLVDAANKSFEINLDGRWVYWVSVVEEPRETYVLALNYLFSYKQGASKVFSYKIKRIRPRTFKNRL